MRKIYQRDWFEIEFSSFTKTSSRTLADAAFYEAFYQAFFQRYRLWDDLDLSWRNQKRAIAKFLMNYLGPATNVLSVGCGLGWVEHCLLEMSRGAIHLEATEVASASLEWLRQELPPGRLHLGAFPRCLPPGRRYDLIYLSIVDYCLDQASLEGLLAQAAPLLAAGGKCLIISGSLDITTRGWPRALSRVKQAAKALLEALNLYQRGQFWGWSRTPQDYVKAFIRAGFAEIKEGFLEVPESAGLYWIEARPQGETP